MVSVVPVPGYPVPQGMTEAELEKIRRNYDIYGEQMAEKKMRANPMQQSDTPDTFMTDDDKDGDEDNLEDEDGEEGNGEYDEDGGVGHMFLAIEPFLQWLRVFGLLPAKIHVDAEQREGWCSVLAKVYSVLLLLIFLFAMSRSVIFLAKVSTWQFDLVITLGIYITISSIQALVNSVNMHRKHDDIFFLLDQWQEIENWFRVDLVSESARNLAIGCLCLSLSKLIGLCVLVGLIMSGDIPLPSNIFYLLVYPAIPTDRSELSQFAQIMVLVSSILVLQATFSPLYLFSMLGSSLARQFDLITDRFNDEVANKSLNADVLRSIRDKHHFLTRLLQLLQDIFSSILLTHLFSSLLLSLLLIYPLIFTISDGTWRAVLLSLLLLHLLTLTITGYNASSVEKAATGLDPHEASQGEVRDEERRELLLLSDKLRTRGRGLSLGRTSMALIYVFIIIYTLLLLQYKQTLSPIISYNMTIP